MTAILFENEVEGPEATAKMATESPENGGADIEGAGSKSANRLLSVRRVVGILKNLKSRGRTGQHTRIGQQRKVTPKCFQFF